MAKILASATVAINALAKQKKSRGERVYNFSAGDPVLSAHPAIVSRATRMIEERMLPYPPVEGLSELRHMASDWMNITCKTHYAKENVMVTCGGKFALFAAIFSIVPRGKEVLIPSPYWVSYPEIVRMAGGFSKIIPTDRQRGWKITKQLLADAVSESSAVLIFNNACNPTGVLYTKEEIAEILEMAKQYNLTVISDEVYSGLAYEEPGFISCGSFREYEEQVIVIQSCSKNFGMTGWRIGFVFAPEPVIKAACLFQAQTITGTPLPSQWAAIGALESAVEVQEYVKNSMKTRRGMFIQAMRSHFPGSTVLPPSSAIYVFAPLSTFGLPETMQSDRFCERLMELYNIALVPGEAFGQGGYVRFAFSDVENEIEEGLCQFRRAVSDIVKGT